MFGLNNSLSTIINHADDFATIQRSLLRAIQEHGGDNSTLNAFLEDIRGEQKELSAIAKRLVSPLWVHTGQTFDLGPIDFEKPMAEFCAEYPQVQIAKGIQETNFSYLSFEKPRAPCTYRLVHLGSQPLLFDEMLEAKLDERARHAGWRELVAFTAKLSPSDFRNCRINAAGSRQCSKGQTEPHTIVPATVESQGELCMVWSGVKRRGRDRNFGPDSFYLMRQF